MKNCNAVLKVITTFLVVVLLYNIQEIRGQVRVTRVTGPEVLAGKNGVVYTLPRTRLHADIRIVRTEQFAGPLAAFAKEMVGIADAAVKNSVSYSIEGVSLYDTREPDPEQVYLIEKEEKSQNEIWIAFGESAPVMTLERFDKTLRPAGFSSWNSELFVPQDPEGLFRKFTDSPTREIVDTIIRKVSIDTLVLIDKTFKRSMVEFSDREKAQEAASRIRQIEQDQYNLMIGYQETAYSIEALEYMFNKLEEQRLEYLRLFTGVSVEETINFDLQAVPDPGIEEQTYLLGGFSKTAGMTEAEGQNSLLLKLLIEQGNVLPPDKADGHGGTGLAYRMPASVQASVSFQGKELAIRNFGILQLGPVLRLPAEFKRIEFDMDSGSLKSLVLE